MLTKALILFHIATLCLASDNTGLRWNVQEPDGTTIRMLTDSQRVIALEYNSKGQLIKCWNVKEGQSSSAISLLFYSVMADAQQGNKEAVVMDIDKVLSSCKRYFRQVFKGTDTALQEEIERMDTLTEGVDGTKFCGFIPKSSTKSKLALKREDKCCRKWHQCKIKIAAHDLVYMTLNNRGHTLLGCNCTVELEECLNNISTSLSEEIRETFFTTSNIKCITVREEKTQCAKWDEFYDKCTKYDWVTKASITTLRQYKEELAQSQHQLAKEKSAEDGGQNQPIKEKIKEHIQEDESVEGTTGERSTPTGKEKQKEEL